MEEKKKTYSWYHADGRILGGNTFKKTPNNQNSSLTLIELITLDLVRDISHQVGRLYPVRALSKLPMPILSVQIKRVKWIAGKNNLITLTLEHKRISRIYLRGTKSFNGLVVFIREKILTREKTILLIGQKSFSIIEDPLIIKHINKRGYINYNPCFGIH